MNGGLCKYKPCLQKLNTKKEGVKFIFLKLDFELAHCGFITSLVSDLIPGIVYETHKGNVSF